MIIRRQTTDQSLVINTEQDFQTDLGWEDNLMQFEEEVLKDIVNPIENYETVRYIHSPYVANNVTQTDIWFYFYFIGTGGTYTQDYQVVGISNQDNEHLLPQSVKSFFRLELFKTPGTVSNNELTCERPTRQNRKLVFAKNLSLPIGEKVFDPILKGHLHIPIFTGSNYRNKENMYMFWFADESVLTETYLSGSTTGNTFFMTAKFYDAENGHVLDFTNNCYSTGHTVNEANDMYFQVDIDKRDYSYKIYRYTNGQRGTQVGTISSPIRFYEKGGSGCPNLSLITPTPTVTPTRPIGTPPPTPTLTPTKSPNPLGVSSIMLSSGTTIADACTGATQTYFYSSTENFGVNGTAIYTNTALTNPAMGSNSSIRYYYSMEYNTVYYINSSDGKKYHNVTDVCPTPTPVLFEVSNLYVDSTDALACGNAQFGPVTLWAYGTNVSNISGFVWLPQIMTAYLGTDMYVRQTYRPTQGAEPITQVRHYTRSGTGATVNGAVADCSNPTVTPSMTASPYIPPSFNVNVYARNGAPYDPDTNNAQVIYQFASQPTSLMYTTAGIDKSQSGSPLLSFTMTGGDYLNLGVFYRELDGLCEYKSIRANVFSESAFSLSRFSSSTGALNTYGDTAGGGCSTQGGGSGTMNGISIPISQSIDVYITFGATSCNISGEIPLPCLSSGH
jgi:hypothetical protein